MFYGKTYAGKRKKRRPDRSTGFSRNYLPRGIAGEKSSYSKFWILYEKREKAVIGDG
jgi:hypothetical protein